MATSHPASAYADNITNGRPVNVTFASGTTVKAMVKKIIGGTNDLVLLVPLEGDKKDEELKIRAERLTKVRGPLAGTKRGPNKGSAQTSDDDEDTDEEVSSETSGLRVFIPGNDESTSMELAEQMLAAHLMMADILKGAIAASKKKPAAAKPEKKKKGIMGSARKVSAEDEDEG